jgi:uncharacterized protein
MLSRALIFIVKLYQGLVSPYLTDSCRYNPTCSQYMVEAIETWGPFKGFYLGIKRILRCHPWGSTGWDPVPKKEKSSPSDSLRV